VICFKYTLRILKLKWNSSPLYPVLEKLIGPGKINEVSTKREVWMAGYWPRFFLCVYGPRWSQDP